MDDSAFSDYRERIGTTLATRLANALSQGAITEEELPIIAKHILENIDKPKNHAELMKFLEEISIKWKIFAPILVVEQSQIKENVNAQTVGQIETLIKDNRLDEAMKTAEAANQEVADPTLQQKGVVN